MDSPDVFIHHFNNLIESKLFCCIGARRANTQNNLFYKHSKYPKEDILNVYNCLEYFSTNNIKGKEFYSAIVFFNEVKLSSEKDFECFLWDILTRLNDIDKNKYNWATGYSKNTNDKHFSFSIAGEAFFIVGLHPMAHRISRRFYIPTLVFNHHAMFEKLKASGNFERYKTAIRKNEMRIQGLLNKHLHDFDDHSEASQYASTSDDKFNFSMIFKEKQNDR
ncbi:guanitoxin biosynthesis heme-dependent pre-guanitoxin N-hydroxylase GntA [Escherichia coli]